MNTGVEIGAPIGDSAISRCLFYRRMCGLPCAVDSGTGRIILTVGSVTGVTLPADLGRSMLDRSTDCRQLDVGPIISHPRSGRWTILVQSNVADYREVFGRLYRLDATLAPLGAQIALPSPADEGSAWRRWVRPPSRGDLPLATVVIDALVLAHRGATGRSK
ncbi:DNA-directed RNA polymerase subunit beta [Nocardia cyriacigeorgica]|uniref:DNA-directed RNA polymerase subunit beta n=1 Tax=Nocardia cyriacigeorgica TaxID=135487 RepID=UPI0018947327|nr:DNA-directed RNA polymerase subunit beta [Nocardia cyriacigeorgica]MBF6435661.1 DNA-directed RNA polymerase subunit beta [Nocardia cyriacigeorgica]MBF6454259.1 DNA-directed RNA polymerase subunit beta [Nocardia cyriacigeorgica]MBF6477892.1 DNA-directed RNA polymerase subunit beta [Nocardia cyriacigeorgica]MBF6552153.1 DNA-directed RNA polymerase subunit beta [Nocardia cyriacigeorgica]